MFPKDGYMSLVSVSTCYHIMPSAASVAPEQPEHWSSFAPDVQHAAQRTENKTTIIRILPVQADVPCLDHVITIHNGTDS